MGDEGIDLSRLHVLLVEDERFAVRLETMALRQLRITNLTVAEDGDEALRLLRERHFDIVLSDWNMPGVSGIELLQSVRDSKNPVPFIMLTGNKAMDAVQRAVAAGVDGYLVKPFSVSQVRAKIIHALRRHGRLPMESV